MITAQTLYRLQLETPNEATLLQFEPDTVAAIHYKLSVDRDMKVSHHKAIGQRTTIKSSSRIEKKKSNCQTNMRTTANNSWICTPNSSPNGMDALDRLTMRNTASS